MSVFSNVYEYLGALFNIKDVVGGNEKLQQELSDSRLKVNQLQSLKTENKELRALLKLKQYSSFNSIPAEVIAASKNTTSSIVIINKGSDSGIKLDSYVISELGLVGRVIEVANKTSKVILADDANFKIEAAVSSIDNEIGLLVGGMKDNICYMKYLSKEADVNIGDTVITKGYGSFMPQGIPIGEIKSITPSENSFFKRVLISTYVDLRKIRFVLCLNQE